MAGILNAIFYTSIQDNFKKKCLTLFSDAYSSSIVNRDISTTLHENDISAILNNYIDNNPKRKKWHISSEIEHYIFDKTITNYHTGFAGKQSRIDFKFGNFWNGNEFKYFVEAKNLKSNDSSLKRRYIKTGIDNFLAGGKYQNCDGFLVGYVLEGTINNCKDGVNKLLVSDGRNTEVLNLNNLFTFDSFLSSHPNRDLDHFFLSYQV